MDLRVGWATIKVYENNNFNDYQFIEITLVAFQFAVIVIGWTEKIAEKVAIICASWKGRIWAGIALKLEKPHLLVRLSHAHCCLVSVQADRSLSLRRRMFEISCASCIMFQRSNGQLTACSPGCWSHSKHSSTSLTRYGSLIKILVAGESWRSLESRLELASEYFELNRG